MQNGKENSKLKKKGLKMRILRTFPSEFCAEPIHSVPQKSLQMQIPVTEVTYRKNKLEFMKCLQLLK